MNDSVDALGQMSPQISTFRGERTNEFGAVARGVYRIVSDVAVSIRMEAAR